MFSHVFVGVTDFDRALAFYNPLMDALEIKPRFCEYDRPWAGWQSDPGPRPLFLIGRPFANSVIQQVPVAILRVDARPAASTVTTRSC